MKRYLFAYLATALTVTAMDMTWLTLTAAAFYRPRLGPIALAAPRLAPAVLFYLLYFAGITYFATTPALKEGSWKAATRNGALLGLLAYATYDLTNEATLTVWPAEVSLVDMAWGMVLTAAGATTGYLAGKRAARPS
jgi:uncharacterized membrane protein